MPLRGKELTDELRTCDNAKSPLCCRFRVDIVPAFEYNAPWYLKMLPFYRRASKALTKMFSLSGKRTFKDSRGHPKMLAIGCITPNDEGFKEILETIKLERPISGEILEMGRAYGELPIRGFQTSPNNMIYILKKGDDEEIWEAILFSPVEPERIYELKKWVRDFATRKIAGWTMILGIIWIVVMVLVVFGD